MPWIALIVILYLFSKGSTMAFSIKPGVFGTLRDEMRRALDAVQSVWRLNHITTPPVITSIEDGQHMKGSLHYQGLAFDVRLNDIMGHNHETLRDQISRIAGNQYDIVHENHGTPSDHMHIEYDPK